jgi:hypothetical protein
VHVISGEFLFKVTIGCGWFLTPQQSHTLLNLIQRLRERSSLLHLEVLALEANLGVPGFEKLQNLCTTNHFELKELSVGGDGLVSTRNKLIQNATGDWIIFLEPETLDAETLLRVLLELEKGSEHLGLITISSANTFPEVAFKKTSFNTLPKDFAPIFSATLFNLDQIQIGQLSFDPRLETGFSETRFISQYLLGLPEKRDEIGYLELTGEAWRDQAGDSRDWSNPELFTHVPIFGWLETLKESKEKAGTIPKFLQRLVALELVHYFEQDHKMNIERPENYLAICREFLEQCKTLCRYIEKDVFAEIKTTPSKRLVLEYLSEVTSNTIWRAESALLGSVDKTKRIQALSFRFSGQRPEINIQVNGENYIPEHAKVMAIKYFNQNIMSNYICWVPTRSEIVLIIDGAKVPVVKRAKAREQLPSKTEPTNKELASRLSQWRVFKGLFKDAWVLLDRTHNSFDNAEHLFRYLQRNRKDINSWFVLEKGTPDWKRLKALGYQRLVPYGGLVWKVLMLNAKHLISSHAHASVSSPPEISNLLPGKPQWKFTFLQHGVTQNDFSIWLNPKRASLIVTSTVDEHNSMVADYTPYAYTSKEVKLAGMPRHDQLLVEAASFSKEEKDTILIAPTWRQWLVGDRSEGSGSKRQMRDDFDQSDWFKYWFGLIQSSELKDLAEQSNKKIVLLPHPELTQYLKESDVPSYVSLASYEGASAQKLFARTALLITDYSSVAFELALIKAPIIYFQFDFERVYNGLHTFRPGYFDFEKHGFGPVSKTIKSTILRIKEVIDDGFEQDKTYSSRSQAAFPLRDGNNCKRVVDAINDLG